MISILHMSDFHLGKDEVKEKDRLSYLANWLIEKRIRIDYLIFTGDIVDAPTIQRQCFEKVKTQFSELLDDIDIESKEKIEKIIERIRTHDDAAILYDETLKNKYVQKMKEAGDIFTDFRNKLGLDADRTICCCGNHDRPHFLRNAIEYICTNNKIDEDKLDESFGAYDLFCEKVNNKLSHKTFVHQAGDFTFVIANSNWKIPQNNNSNNMCISCYALEQKLEELKSVGMKRSNVILVSHKPFDDICENAKFIYDDARRKTTYNKIEKMASMFFYGDKHSANLKLNQELKEFMCGMPLENNRLRYNLVEYDPENEIANCQNIVYMNNEWTLMPIPDYMEKVYNASYDYLKETGFVYLEGEKRKLRDWDKAIEFIERASKTQRLLNTSRLFSACCTLKKNNAKKSLSNEILYDEFLTIIEKSNTNAPISVKGAPGIGKSTFLTIEYLYAFYRFSNGTTKYIPFYFSIDRFLQEVSIAQEPCNSSSIEEYFQECLQKFEAALDNCLLIGKNQNMPICIFIDGIEKQKILSYRDSLEAHIYRVINQKYKGYSNKFVMCMNVHNESEFDNSFKYVNHFDYVLFMNSIRTSSYRAKEGKLDSFLQSFLALQNHDFDDQQISKMKKKLSQFRKMEIDLFFLHHCYNLINDADDSSWKNMRKYEEFLSSKADVLFNEKEHIAQKVACKVFLKGMSFQEIVEENSDSCLSIFDFMNICNTPEVTEYLLAGYFVEELVAASYTTKPIPNNCILKGFIPRNLAILVRLILDEREINVQRLLDRFICNHGTELYGYLYSNIIYLAGHTHKGDGNKILRRLKEDIYDPKKKTNCFEYYCCKRSYDLAVIVCDKQATLADLFILNLINDEKFRLFNRLYQLHFYQDTVYRRFDTWEYWTLENIDKQGFDFRNMFSVLVSKLIFCKQNEQSYPMMSIDLFTLCDIMYYKLQKIDPKGLFYAEEYTTGENSLAYDVLKKTCELIEYQLKQYTKKRPTYKQIQVYFDEMKDVFHTAKENLKKGSISKELYPSETFKQVLSLETLPRIGWNICVAGDLSQNDIKVINDELKPNDIKETLAEHVLESVYIAQMFLPDHLDDPNYSKEEVISMLLLSELGRAHTHDYTPRYPNMLELKEQEKKHLNRMLLLGSKDGFGNNNKFFESFAHLDRVSKEHNGINMAICLEIKKIQMEYKFYTLHEYIAYAFKEDRQIEFKNAFQYELETPICRKIRELLIIKNPDFSGLV